MKVFFLVTRKGRSALGLKREFFFCTETGNLLKMLLPHSLRIKLFESRNQRKAQHNKTHSMTVLPVLLLSLQIAMLNIHL